MATLAKTETRISDAEWALRRDLAACYRLTALYGWDDLVATHISARLPDEEAFLINPFGVFFEEMTASALVKVDLDGNILAPTDYTINAAAFVVHSAIHAVRHDAGCVMHLHTNDGVAVSALEEGVLPLNQTSMLVHRDIAFHEYEGVAVDLDERARLAADLGTKNLMLLRNHGTLALGRTIAECFTSMYFLEWACTTQVRTLSMGRPIHQASDAAIDKVANTRANDSGMLANSLVWPAVLRRLARENPGWDA